MSDTTPTLYDTIGVSADASADEIRTIIRQLANEVRDSRKTKFEKNELLRFFSNTRETLTDSYKRRQYDMSIGIETIDNGGEERSIVRFERSDILQPVGVLDSLIGFPRSDFHGMFSNSMFSNSIIPSELTNELPTGVQPGTFRVLEYTKFRNSDGGFHEFGLTRQGDINHNNVTEKRFERKS